MEIKQITTVLYTVEDLTEHLQVSTRTVFRYIKQGFIRPIRFKNDSHPIKNYFEKSEVDRFLSGEFKNPFIKKKKS